MCYVPPVNSTRRVDVLKFFDALTVNIYKYQKLDIVLVLGDFNSRCGDTEFKVGVQLFPSKTGDVIDFNANRYGAIRCDFLIVCVSLIEEVPE